MPEKTIGRFRLLEECGGGLGSLVFRAEETLPDGGRRIAAVKIRRSPDETNPRFVERFLHEAELQRRFEQAPHMVRVYDAGSLGASDVWVAMEYVPRSVGRTIGDDPCPTADVVRMLQHIGAALDHLHSSDALPLLHRDVKAANVLVRGAGPRTEFLLTDPELPAEPELPMPRGPVSAMFVAPEFCHPDRRHESPASDLYSLGMLAYLMLLGKRLFAAQFGFLQAAADPSRVVGDWLQWHCSPKLLLPAVHQLRPAVDSGLSEVVARLTAKRPDDRFASAAALLQELTAFGEAPAPVRRPSVSAPSRRRLGVRAATLGIAALTVGLGAWTMSRPTPQIELPNDGVYRTERGAVPIVASVLGAPQSASLRVVLAGSDVAPIPLKPRRATDANRREFAGSVALEAGAQVVATIELVDQNDVVLDRATASLVRAPQGAVTIVTTPVAPGATLQVREHGNSAEAIELKTDDAGEASLRLDAGAYDVTLEDARFASSSASFDVKSGRPQREEIRAERRLGTLSISAEPPTATITAQREGDGEVLSLSPVDGTVARSVAPGTWTVVARSPGFVERRQSVAVGKGEKVVLRLELTREPATPPAAVEPEPEESSAPAPATAQVAVPMTLDEVESFVREQLPLAQLELKIVKAAKLVRVSGPVLNDAEVELAKMRLQPFAASISNEIRADPRAVEARARALLRESGIAVSSSGIQFDAAINRLKIRARVSSPSSRATCASLMRTLVLNPDLVDCSWLTP